jgi:hypothetical protein
MKKHDMSNRYTQVLTRYSQVWKIMKQCTDPIGAGCSRIYRQIYRYNPEIHGDLYLYNIYLNTPPQSKGRHRHIDWSET